MAFERERDAMVRLADSGLPIAPLVAAGPDFIVFEDAGTPLKNLLRFEGHPLEDRIAMMEAAANALAALHVAGVSHGRPNLKDILWNGSKAVFIDFERAAPVRDTPRGHAEDVVLFFFSAFAELDDSSVEIEAARKAYIAAGGAPFWELAVGRISKLGWAYGLSRLAAPFLGRGRDFQAIKPTFAFFNSFKGDI
ncbi:MAG: lipopolysaccharide kinase InaA family protein [Lentilitoribacter sp.]